MTDKNQRQPLNYMLRTWDRHTTNGEGTFLSAETSPYLDNVVILARMSSSLFGNKSLLDF